MSSPDPSPPDPSLLPASPPPMTIWGLLWRIGQKLENIHRTLTELVRVEQEKVELLRGTSDRERKAREDAALKRSVQGGF